jgi:penicillin-binding protein 2
MKKPTRIITEHSQGFTFTRRAMFLGAAQAAVGVVLAGRMAWLSIAENERYRLMAEDNRVQMTLIPPRRGWIVDRRGQPIAINRTDFRVDLIPDRLEHADRTLAFLRETLALSDDDMDRIRAGLDKAAGYQPVPVAENVDYERFAAISVRQAELPGVTPARGWSRYYPAGAAVGHLVGYVGAASAKDYEEKRDPLLITPGFKVGKDGLEKTMEDLLRGKPGARQSEVTARGKLVRDLETRADVPGGALRLTIDAGLQEYAARRIGPESGSVVVMDCRTGDLLALASMPAYDPNSFSDGIGRSEYAMLNADDHLPLLNKTLQGLYPPGSTVKPMVALALLKAGISPDQSVLCTGRYRLGSGNFHCWRRGGHGSVNMSRAIHQSCDVYFYEAAKRTGVDKIGEVARKLGLGDFTWHRPDRRAAGHRSDARLETGRARQPWHPGENLVIGIGQGYVTTTPLQLAVMAARLANGGYAVSPRIVRKEDGFGPAVDQRPASQRWPSLNFKREQLDLALEGMIRVTAPPRGTAAGARIMQAQYAMAGKTGSSQVRRISRLERETRVRKNEEKPWEERDHALFVAYAPIAAPRYACAVIIEHGISGSGKAAPIAGDVLTWLYDPAKAMERLAKLEEGWGGDIATRMKAKADAWETRNDPPPPTPPAPGNSTEPAGDA